MMDLNRIMLKNRYKIIYHNRMNKNSKCKCKKNQNRQN